MYVFSYLINDEKFCYIVNFQEIYSMSKYLNDTIFKVLTS